MINARRGHTATLLNSGKVLVYGYGPHPAELYDPVTKTFELSGNPAVHHSQGATATLLPDGKVLLVGGTSAAWVAEIYDPESGQFTLTDSLRAPHSFHTATLLEDGTVLIAGGSDPGDIGPITHTVAEIYDPATGSFTLTDSLAEDRDSHTATLLPSGQVLIVGGSQTTTPGVGITLKSCELYDPASASFVSVPDVPGERAGHTATLLANGLVLVAGGNSGKGPELYDPVAQTWSPAGNLSLPGRIAHTATLLPSGHVLLAGGVSLEATRSVELYDPATNTFSGVDSMLTARQQFTATLLTDGTVLVAGGYDGHANTNLAELFTFTPATHVRRDDEPAMPSGFSLSQNFPNPFNPDTRIEYTVPVNSNVQLVVYDVLGQRLKMLFRGKQPAGRHSVDWDGTTDAGIKVGSGVYLLRLRAGDYTAAIKMIIVR